MGEYAEIYALKMLKEEYEARVSQLEHRNKMYEQNNKIPTWEEWLDEDGIGNL